MVTVALQELAVALIQLGVRDKGLLGFTIKLGKHLLSEGFNYHMT